MDNERIDSYLAGTLSQADHAALEAQLASDPALRQEVALQRQVQQALAEHRRAQLRARLEALPTPPVGGASLSVGAWTVSAVAVLTAGVGLWWFTQGSVPAVGPAAQPVVSGAPATNTPAPAPAETIASTAPQPDAVVSNQAASSRAASSRAASSRAASSRAASSRAASSRAATEQAIGSSTADTSPTEGVVSGGAVDSQTTSGQAPVPSRAETAPPPTVLAPEPDDFSSEAPDFEPGGDADAPTLRGSDDAPTPTRRAPVVIKNTSYDFHYAYQQGQLQLYGDFDAGPYQLLDVVGEGQKPQLYMAYDGQFYLLRSDQVSPVRLKPITDQRRVRKLELLLR